MDSDEFYLLAGSAAVTLVLGIRWCVGLLRAVSPQGKWAPGIRLLLGAWPLALLLMLGIVLSVGAAREVREDPPYVALFVALGAVWLAGIAWGTALLGVSARDDAVERNNLAAAVAAAGALTGGLVVYAFANFGEGDSIWTTIGPATVASVSCLALWAVHQAASGAADAIAIDRDIASGVRFAGMTVGTGFIVGRAVAGDYESAAGMLRDLAQQGWPAVLLVALAAFVQYRLKPNRRSPRGVLVAGGLVPAFAYVALGVLDLIVFGSWASKGTP